MSCLAFHALSTRVTCCKCALKDWNRCRSWRGTLDNAARVLPVSFAGQGGGWQLVVLCSLCQIRDHDVASPQVFSADQGGVTSAAGCDIGWTLLNWQRKSR